MEKKKRKHLGLFITLGVIGSLVIVSSSVFFIYVSDYYHASEDAYKSLIKI